MNIVNFTVFFISVTFNCVMNFFLHRNHRKYLLVLSVAFNILYLIVFKYSGFLLNTVSEIVQSDVPTINILLPLGISFYTFQQISILVDNYRGEIKSFSIVDYYLVTSFFPKLVQGPIAYYSELEPQFNDSSKKSFNYSNFANGLYILSIGLAKKVLVADKFGLLVDYGYSHISSLNSFEAVLVIIGYTFQLYFDFSGYCDMAAGSAKMFNIDLPINFNSPYKALDINDFWKRWHITLTRFLTKYIYIPLGGNRKGERRTAINIIIVFLISGIWHGAGLGFIIWGLLHGLVRIVFMKTKEIHHRLPKSIQWFLTFLFINLSWTVFRAEKVSDAFLLISRLITGAKALSISPALTESLLQPVVINIPCQFISLQLVLLIFVAITLAVLVLCENTDESAKQFKPCWKNLIFTYFNLTLSLLSISGVSSFLYVNF